MLLFPNLDRIVSGCAWRWLSTVLLGFFLELAPPASAATTIFHLKGGDRITGTIVSENSEEVRISAPYASSLVLPVNQIEKREQPPPPEPAPAVSTPAAAPPPPPKPAAAPPPVPAAPPVASVATNAPQAHPWKDFFSKWKAELQLGLNVGFSTKDHRTVTSRAKATYSPSRTFRNSLDYLASYGVSEGTVSENRMEGSWKMEHDVGKEKRFLIYNAAGAGYNEIQKIDFRYDVGPGFGYRLLQLTNFAMRVEMGGNYQEQHFSTGLQRERYSLRLGEELNWRINEKLRFDNKSEIFPDLPGLSDFRVRTEANLTYLLRSNLTLTLSLIDIYDTGVPAGVDRNDLQLRSLVGLKF